MHQICLNYNIQKNSKKQKIIVSIQIVISICDKILQNLQTRNRKLSLARKQKVPNDKNIDFQKTCKTIIIKKNDGLNNRQNFPLINVKRPLLYQIKNHSIPINILLQPQNIQPISRQNLRSRSKSVSLVSNFASSLKNQNLLKIPLKQSQSSLNSSYESKQYSTVKNVENQANFILGSDFELTDKKLSNQIQNLYFENQNINKNQQKIIKNSTLINSNLNKVFKNIGTSTDISFDQFNEFLKFKTAQNEKYVQLKNIFQYISNLSTQQNRQFRQRQKDYTKFFERSQNTQRDNQFLNLMKDIDKSRLNFIQCFKSFHTFFYQIDKKISVNYEAQIQKNIKQLRHIKKLLSQIILQNNNNSQNDSIEGNMVFKYIHDDFNKQSNLSNKSNISNKQNKQINNSYSINKNIIQKIRFKLNKNIEELNNFQQKQTVYKMKLSQQVSQQLETIHYKCLIYKQRDYQKNSILKHCINQILKLPQMSLIIFGMSQKQSSCIDTQALNNLGINLDDIPQFTQFFSKDVTKKHIDTGYKKLMSYKCLTCAYLKSKMRFIYDKNQELKPIIKMMNNIVTLQKKESYNLSNDFYIFIIFINIYIYNGYFSNPIYQQDKY